MRTRPIVLGIVGDSAAGKTTLTGGLSQLLGNDLVTRICTDDYHKYDRVERAERQITAIHPECNYIDIMELQLERLHYGQPILKPVYDHSNGTLVRPEYVQPKEIVICEGLLGYSTPNMRQFYDVKVYLGPPEDLRRVWKIKRDCAKRGYKAEQVIKELEAREHDSRDYIRPQREFADIIVEFCPPDGVAPEKANGNLSVRLILRPTIRHPNISYLFEDNNSQDSGIRMTLGRDSGKPVDILEIDGDVTQEHADKLAKTIREHLPNSRRLPSEAFGNYQADNETRHSHPLALTQLLLTYHLLRERELNPKPLFAKPVAALSRIQPQQSTAAGVSDESVIDDEVFPGRGGQSLR